MTELVEIVDTQEMEISLDEKLNLLADAMMRFNDKKRKFDEETAVDQEIIKSLKEQISSEILDLGESVSNDLMTVVYRKGQEKWDGLDAYAKFHPEILALKTVGEPSVQFRLKKFGK